MTVAYVISCGGLFVFKGGYDACLKTCKNGTFLSKQCAQCTCIGCQKQQKIREKRVEIPRKFKGESVVVAILPSHMEMSDCTSGFFRS